MDFNRAFWAKLFPGGGGGGGGAPSGISATNVLE